MIICEVLFVAELLLPGISECGILPYEEIIKLFVIIILSSKKMRWNLKLAASDTDTTDLLFICLNLIIHYYSLVIVNWFAYNYCQQCTVRQDPWLGSRGLVR